jgi:hypothetical protein
LRLLFLAATVIERRAGDIALQYKNTRRYLLNGLVRVRVQRVAGKSAAK